MSWKKCKHIDVVIFEKVWVYGSCPNPNKKESQWFAEDYVTTDICKKCDFYKKELNNDI